LQNSCLVQNETKLKLRLKGFLGNLNGYSLGTDRLLRQGGVGVGGGFLEQTGGTICTPLNICQSKMYPPLILEKCIVCVAQ
jgi:hypothetical protein